MFSDRFCIQPVRLAKGKGCLNTGFVDGHEPHYFRSDNI
jgi:hypothetical protein